MPGVRVKRWLQHPEQSDNGSAHGLRSPEDEGSITMTSSDATRRGFLETAVGAGGAFLGGSLIPGGIPRAAAQVARAASAGMAELRR